MNNKLIIAGDLLPQSNNLSLFCSGDVQNLFGEELVCLFKSAEFCICNLEGPLTGSDQRIEKSGANLKAPINAVAGIKELGINIVCMANNHIMDYGAEGLKDTLDTLINSGIDYIGVGQSSDTIKDFASINILGKSIIIYNVAETEFNAPSKDTPGVNIFEEYRVCKRLEQLKKQCDHLIVIYHGGAEKYRYPSPKLKARLHLMSDCGADIILAQHSHCIGTPEKYNGTEIVYGQGDFCFTRKLDDFTETGLIIEVVVEEHELKYIYHKVKRVHDIVRYDSDQDLSSFWARGLQVSDDQFIYNSFVDYCRPRLQGYVYDLGLYSGTAKLISRIMRKLKLVDDSRKKQLIINDLNTIRCEVHQEVVEVGLKDLLKHFEE